MGVGEDGHSIAFGRAWGVGLMLEIRHANPPKPAKNTPNISMVAVILDMATIPGMQPANGKSNRLPSLLTVLFWGNKRRLWTAYGLP